MGDKRMMIEMDRKEMFMDGLLEKLENRRMEKGGTISLIGFDNEFAFAVQTDGSGEAVVMNIIKPWFKPVDFFDLNEFVYDFTALTYMFYDEIADEYGCLEKAMEQCKPQ